MNEDGTYDVKFLSNRRIKKILTAYLTQEEGCKISLNLLKTNEKSEVEYESHATFYKATYRKIEIISGEPVIVHVTIYQDEIQNILNHCLQDFEIEDMAVKYSPNAIYMSGVIFKDTIGLLLYGTNLNKKQAPKEISRVFKMRNTNPSDN